MFTTHRERRNGAAFGSAQLAHDLQDDPAWDEPDRDPDDEPPPADDFDPPDLEGL